MAKTKLKNMSEDLASTPVEETQVDQAQEAAAETLMAETVEEVTQEAISDAVAEENPEAPAKGKKVAGKREKGVAKPKKGQKIRSKKYQEKAESVEKAKLYPINEAVEAAKNASYSKFEGTFEIHVKTNAKNLRGLINLPFVSGKKLTILAFGKDAADSGADIIGDDATISAIQKGKLGFDAIITTPEWMPKLAKAAAILGPRGLMPNPKSGSITENLKKAVSELQSGKTEYKTEKGGQVIHLGIGKVSQPTEEISQNIRVLLITVGKSRVKKASLAPSMGPAVKLDLSSI